MLYPVVIHKDPESDYGVTVPDLPGCISAGETLEEALAMVREAIELHIEGLLEDGEQAPLPSSFEALRETEDLENGVLAVVDIDVNDLMGPMERINITVPRRALKRIDAAAEVAGMNRSQFLTRSALDHPVKGSKAIAGSAATGRVVTKKATKASSKTRPKAKKAEA